MKSTVLPLFALAIACRAETVADVADTGETSSSTAAQTEAQPADTTSTPGTETGNPPTGDDTSSASTGEIDDHHIVKPCDGPSLTDLLERGRR